MKTVAFFNEKGGVGKSIMNVMYASWLQYRYGVKVAVVDFNDRLVTNRKAEISDKTKLGIIDQIDMDSIYPIINASKKEIDKFRDRGVTVASAAWFENLLNTTLKGYDVIVIDFPGSLEGNSFNEICMYRLLSQAILIIDKNFDTFYAATKVMYLLKGVGIPYCSFVNQAKLNLKNYASIYESIKKFAMEKDMNLLPDTVSFSDKITVLNKPKIMRSSLTFPDWDDPAFEGARDLGIENLFIDVTRELDKRDDRPRTEHADLSFVKSLTKHDDGRQYHGTSFKEYEI